MNPDATQPAEVSDAQLDVEEPEANFLDEGLRIGRNKDGRHGPPSRLQRQALLWLRGEVEH